MRRQGARDHTTGGEEIGLSHLALQTKADHLLGNLCISGLTYYPCIAFLFGIIFELLIFFQV